MMRRFAFAALLTGLATAAHAQDIRPAAQRIASAWQRADVGVLGAQTAKAGLSIDLAGERVGPYGSGRQAAAALKRLFEDRETVSISVATAKETGGEPRRGYVELNWVTRTRGSRIPEHSVVVVAMEVDRDQWRITEIRLMR
jgi:hypothetical protein